MCNETPEEYYEFVNTAYWRTCSLLLEETVRNGFLTKMQWLSVLRRETGETLRHLDLAISSVIQGM